VQALQTEKSSVFLAPLLPTGKGYIGEKLGIFKQTAGWQDKNLFLHSL
jgi:hypothetical protein